jgi:hypothetical protein
VRGVTLDIPRIQRTAMAAVLRDTSPGWPGAGITARHANISRSVWHITSGASGSPLLKAAT